MKRLFDFLAAAAATLVLSPLLIPVILVLRFTGEGEVFYRQERIGRGGKPFGILKFATMLKNSPNLAGGDITVGNDPRVLPFGRFLRKSKINELPQLFNVLLGDMAIIGPRPLTRRIADMFPAGHWETVGTLRPGLSGIGSIVFRDEERLFSVAADREKAYAEVVAPYKSALERWYAANQSFALDIKLIWLTVLAVLKPELDVSSFINGLPQPPQELLALRGA
jgi:lipopolysaccharide/colanic/teichoic acid biosynthesis glycosyltransferase